MRKIRSAVWDYFTKKGRVGHKVTECNTCKAPLPYKSNTTNMINHLRIYHSAAYELVLPHLRRRTQPANRRPIRQPGLLDEAANEDDGDSSSSDSHNEDEAGFSTSWAPSAGSSVVVSDGNLQSPVAEPSTSAELPSQSNSSQSRSSSTVSSTPVSGPPVMCSTPEEEHGREPYERDGFRFGHIIRALMIFIVRGLYPLCIVDDPNLQALVTVLDPRMKLPCRNTITNNYLPSLYLTGREHLLTELLGATFVALTTDMWSSRHQESFMTVTVHFINERLQMVSRVLETVSFPESHTAQNIADRLITIARDWNIFDKVVMLVTDNAANMISAARLIPTWRHYPCFAHTLQLVIKDALAATELEEVLAKARAIVTFFHSSNIASNKLKYFSLPRSSRRTLAADVPTRWNSTCIMLRSLLELKESVCDALYCREVNRPELDLQDYEWEMLSGVVNILAPFEEITTDLSSQSYPSLSKLIPAVRLLQASLVCSLAEQRNPDPLLRELEEQLLNGLRSRFRNIELSTSILLASYLDPRFKHLHLTQEDQASAQSRLRGLIQFSSENEPSSEDLFADPDRTPRVPFSIWRSHDSSMASSNSRRGNGPNREANRLVLVADYADQPIQPRTIDPLKWWWAKKKDGMFIQLIPLVRKFLCIPATSVPSEQLFSKAGELIREKRNAISPDNVNMILFLNKNA